MVHSVPIKYFCCLVVFFLMLTPLSGQHVHHEHSNEVAVEAQPLLAQALRLEQALSFLGSPLPAGDAEKLRQLQHEPPSEIVVRRIQEILDPYCLAIVSINPEARVKVMRGEAAAELMQGGWTSFLVKVHNDAQVTAALEAESPNARTPVHAPSFNPRVREKDIISPGEARNRFLELHVYRNRPLQSALSGLKLEYAVLQVFSKDSGKREAEIGFNVGQGTQDIGFRNTINVLFDIKPSVKVTLGIKDDDGSPAMASLLITDGIERIPYDSTSSLHDLPFHLAAARSEYRSPRLAPKLRGIYPLPSRRVAAYDEYPDFFFQPQVYRKDGEHVMLPPGDYDITYSRGPEYIPQTLRLNVPESAREVQASFRLKRWIDLSALGWYSGDHHIHGAGCSHYDSPEEGVPPQYMWRQIVGEDLNIAASLAWGPSWYHQKTFFTGEDEPYSTKDHIMRNDVEVSGFPSSHAGHIVLLNLREDDYPGTTRIEEWPSWTLPVLKWAKDQGGIVGYAHSGWGLEPVERTTQLPNYVMPKMDGIGANEYIVTVTTGIIDIYSAGNTPAPSELNMWYHTLNAGFRTRLSGETDFPCIFDERVGLARSYFKPDGKLTYDNWVKALQQGRSYVTEGGAHILDFKVGGVEAGTGESQVSVRKGKQVQITARVVARLSPEQDAEGRAIAGKSLYEQPYWHIERARLGQTQNVKVELVVNGEAVTSRELTADGKWNGVTFDYAPEKSCWMALRIFPGVHTNPVFVEVDQEPIRVLRSAEWCRKAVDQCWEKKMPNIRENERAAAAKAYDNARAIYDGIIREARR